MFQVWIDTTNNITQIIKQAEAGVVPSSSLVEVKVEVEVCVEVEVVVEVWVLVGIDVEVVVEARLTFSVGWGGVGGWRFEE